MVFRKFLVPVSGGGRDACALATAFAAAQLFPAHVAALFVQSDPREALPFGELPLSPDFVQELIDSASSVAEAASAAAQNCLAGLAEKHNISITASPQSGGAVTASYAEVTGYLPHVLGRAARLSDLVVFPSLRKGEAHDLVDAFCRVLFKSACPVLLAPEVAPIHVGKQIAIGWDDGISCARAMVSAVPFLKQAAGIEIISVGDGTTPAKTAEAEEYLRLQGLRAEVRQVAKGGRKVAEALLSTAEADGADMLVIGGYSRGRMAEAVFGGVSEHIVTHLAIPVYMVH